MSFTDTENGESKVWRQSENWRAHELSLYNFEKCICFPRLTDIFRGALQQFVQGYLMLIFH